jgi:hypothetical protein
MPGKGLVIIKSEGFEPMPEGFHFGYHLTGYYSGDFVGYFYQRGF